MFFDWLLIFCSSLATVIIIGTVCAVLGDIGRQFCRARLSSCDVCARRGDGETLDEIRRERDWLRQQVERLQPNGPTYRKSAR